MANVTNAPILDSTGQSMIDKLNLIASRVKPTGGGGGGTGTDDYTDLENKPSIENVTLVGNKTASDLGLQTELQIDNAPAQGSNGVAKSGGIYSAIQAATETVTVSQASADFEEVFGPVEVRPNNMYTFSSSTNINSSDITYDD